LPVTGAGARAGGGVGRKNAAGFPSLSSVQGMTRGILVTLCGWEGNRGRHDARHPVAGGGRCQLGGRQRDERRGAAEGRLQQGALQGASYHRRQAQRLVSE